ncbi:MAG TPA: hypothetical protein VE465_17655 [Streptosporangiaceae bacterium]|nr:hypothetical protein [Streptosporangiaceae bacterium]
MELGDQSIRQERLMRLIRQLPLLTIGILSAFVPIVDLTGLLDNIPWLQDRLPALTLLTVGAIAFYLAFERATVWEEVTEIKQLISAVSTSGEGFRKVPPSEISKIAAQMMKDVGIVRTLGTVVQDLLDIDPSAKLYLRETERRVSRNSPPLRYYRITSDRLRETFLNHLDNLLSADARHEIQLEVSSDIETTITYQIFDSAHVLVILENPHVPGRRDYAVAMMSSDQEIVDGFIAHFDAAWSQKTPIDDPQELRNKITQI